LHIFAYLTLEVSKSRDIECRHQSSKNVAKMTICHRLYFIWT